jgi:hypothetical protein
VLIFVKKTGHGLGWLNDAGFTIDSRSKYKSMNHEHQTLQVKYSLLDLKKIVT